MARFSTFDHIMNCENSCTTFNSKLRHGTQAAICQDPANVSFPSWACHLGLDVLVSVVWCAVRSLRSPCTSGITLRCLYRRRHHRPPLLNPPRARNKFFTSATEAFRRGEGLAARDLARRGRELNSKMKEKHHQAATEIFSSRNPGDQVNWAIPCWGYYATPCTREGSHLCSCL